MKGAVQSFEVEHIDKGSGRVETCKVFRAPYLIAGDADIVQLDTGSEDKGGVKEVRWGPPGKEFSVKCVEHESQKEDKVFNFVEKAKTCVAEIEIIPKTPVAYIQYRESDTCGKSITVDYVYVYPHGWFA